MGTLSLRHHLRVKAAPGPRSPAFSLVEVVLVLAIIATLAGLSIPRFANSLNHFGANGAADRIVSDLAWAQHRAAGRSAAQTVTFDPVNHAYTLNGVTDIDDKVSEYTVDLTEEPYQARIISADFGGDAVVIFDGYGTPDTGGAIVIQVGDYQKTVTLDADTGRAVRN